MKKPHIIHITELSFTEFKYWEGQPLSNYYHKIQQFLSQRLGEKFDDFLANSQLKKNEKGVENIRWIVSSELGNIKKIEQFNDSALLAQTNELLGQIKDLTDELSNSKNKNDKNWASLLTLAFSDSDVGDFYSNGKKVFIINWSLNDLSKPQNGGFSIGFVPPAQKEYLTNEELSKETPEISPDEEDLAVNEELQVEEDTYQEEPIEETLSETPIDAVNNITPEPEELPNNEDIVEAEEVTKPNEDIPRKRNWWWLLLLLLLLLLTFFIFNYFDGCSDNEVPNLPEAPEIIPPIDSTDIGYGEDSIAQIVTNRINIIISSEQTVETFAKDFKEIYKDKNYRIIYYGTNEIKRLQIQVPKEDRSRLMKEIPQKLKDYKLLLFEEGLLQYNKIPSETDFSNPRKSWYLENVKAFEAWDKTWGDNDVIVAVIDDGFDLGHPELANKIVAPYNVITGNTSGMLRGKGGEHGTHVGGTAIGARDNNAGLSGIAPDCKLMPIRISTADGLMPQTAVVDAILYAINQGADVINLSLGMLIDPYIASLSAGMQQNIIDNSYQAEETFWNQLLKIADDSNVTIVMAAGNQNVLIGLDPMNRTPYSIIVSAIEQSQNKAQFSNYGKKSTISAPGTDIYSSIPNNKFSYLSGTSMASPIVTGAVALLKSINPDLTNTQIKDILVTTGEPLNSNIGPLLQLDKALGIVDSTGVNLPQNNCNDVSAKIDSLLLEIEKLKEQCPDQSQKDTMIIPDVINDLGFTHGIWESTTSLYNSQEEKVKIRFEFLKNNSGIISLIEANGTVCKTDLTLTHTQNQFDINQLKDAVCPGNKDDYNPYYFSCRADANGNAQCTAQNKVVSANKFNFTLIKIK